MSNSECVRFTGLRQWGMNYNNSDKECVVCGVLGKYHPVPPAPPTLAEVWREGYEAGYEFGIGCSYIETENPYKGNDLV